MATPCARLAAALRGAHRPLSAPAGKGGRLVGCGSNVVDQFMKVRAIPKVGEKGFFSSPTEVIAASVVGGVTLNHLSWAATLGVPTAGLFLQGNDPSGKMLRAEMERQGVSTEHVKHSDAYATSESYVLLQDDGERSIIMATGSTSEITDAAASEHFAAAVADASIFTTEISQVPLSGVSALLTVAADNGTLSVLDIDVQPSVATNEAGLGSTAQVIDCVKQADILKPAMHAAREVMEVLAPEIRTELATMSAVEVGRRLRDAAGCRLVALTDGGNGCAIVTADTAVTVPIVRKVDVTDATGAGDAFLGGLVAGFYHEGVPVTEAELTRIGQLANATGAACCQAIGGLPVESSASVLAGLLEGTTAADFAGRIVPLGAAAADAGEGGGDGSGAGGAGGVPASLTGFASSIANDAATLAGLTDRVDFAAVERAVDRVQSCTGRVLVTGLGKSGAVARRLAASLASTGTPAHFVHAAEWSHGDLGNVCDNDVVIALSHSGRTAECVHAMDHFKARNATVVTVTSGADSAMARASDIAVVYEIPPDMEPAGGAPTTSVVAQEAIANGIVVELILRRGFTANDFKWNHPGGALGEARL